MPGRADRLGQLGRRAAGAAADIEHPLAGLRLRRLEDQLAEARDAALDAVVGAEPHLAARPVPVRRLLGRQFLFAFHALLPPCATTIWRGM